MGPFRLMAVGLVLLLAAWTVLLLMVIRMLEPSLLLSLGAYAASVTGLVIGLFGAGAYARGRSRHRHPDSDP
jgi:hypothetical protein